MGRGKTVSGMRLRMLTLVLALAPFWYAVNPAPEPVHRVKKIGGSPDEERRDA